MRGGLLQAGALGPGRRTLALWGGAVLVVGAFLALAWERPAPLDDAYITYRYARNLVYGHGLVYNPGEYVEGFTNPLWTFAIAGALALGFQSTVAGHALGVASGVLGLVACAALAAGGLPRTWRWLAPLAPALVVASSPAWTRWSTSGMETALFAAWVSAAAAAGVRERVGWMTAALALATLTRPEGGMMAACLYGTLPLVSRVPWRRAVGGGAAYAAVGLAMTAARLAYYGELLPNTFYAKMGGGDSLLALLQVQRFFSEVGGLLVVPALFAALADRRARPAALCSAAFCVYLVAIGGDAFMHRMLLPVLPLLTALAVWGVAAGWRRGPALGTALAAFLPAQGVLGVFGSLGPAMVVASLGVAAALAWRWGGRVGAWAAGVACAGAATLWLAAAPGLLPAAPRAPTWAQRLDATRTLDRRFETLGRHSARILERRGARLVASAAIGALGYHSDLAVLDILGLVDARIARHRGEDASGLPGHARSHAEYVMSREPDYILITRRPEDVAGLAPRQLPAVRDLWRHPDLDRHYRWDPRVRGYRRVDAPGSGG